MTLNPDTRVIVHCYAGDGPNVVEALHMHKRHECPLTILSPEDSQVIIPGVECRFGGQRQSAGQLSLDRQRRHMEIILEYPEQWFLMNDADSICLSAKFPDYLYREPNVLWSNLVYDSNLEQRGGYAPGWPFLAFQPPYFLHRSVIKRLLSVAEGVRVNPLLPYIDHYMLQLAFYASVTWKAFPDGISYAISTMPGEMQRALVEVRHKGMIFIHSVKGARYWQPLFEAHRRFESDFNASVNRDLNSTANVHPYPLLEQKWSADRQFVSYQPRHDQLRPNRQRVLGPRLRHGIKA